MESIPVAIPLVPVLLPCCGLGGARTDMSEDRSRAENGFVWLPDPEEYELFVPACPVPNADCKP
jgi:hypothetical protein